jgi:hypothetical protein
MEDPENLPFGEDAPELTAIMYDRMPLSNARYLAHHSFLPATASADGEPLEAAYGSVFPGCMPRAIGGLAVKGAGDTEYNILAVPDDDLAPRRYENTGEPGGTELARDRAVLRRPQTTGGGRGSSGAGLARSERGPRDNPQAYRLKSS